MEEERCYHIKRAPHLQQSHSPAPAMGNGTAWIWITLSVSLVHLSPLFIDIENSQVAEISPDYVMRLSSKDLLPPDTGFDGGEKTKKIPFGRLRPMSRLR